MKIFDLTQTLSNGMEVYKGDPKVEIKQVHTLKKDGWRLKLLSLGSHTGSHVDAPSHMNRKGKSIDELPIDRFIGKARLVEIDGIFPKHIGLVFAKGKITLNFLKRIIASRPPFVVIGNAAKLTIEAERRLLKERIITFTDLVNLDKLPKDKSFTFYGVPLKIKDGDGSPIRAFAVIE